MFAKGYRSPATTRRSNSTPHSIIASSIAASSGPPSSPPAGGDRSSGENPTLWKPSPTNSSSVVRRSRLSGVTVTRAETCIRRWRASSGVDAGEDPVVAAAPAAQGTKQVVRGARPVEADGDGEAVLLEEVAVVRGQQGAVGGDREGGGDASLCGQFPRPRAPRHAPRRGSSAARRRGSARLTRSPGATSSSSRSTDGERGRRAPCSWPGRRTSPPLGVAVGAAQVALLRHRERERPHGGCAGAAVVDVGRARHAELVQQGPQRGAVVAPQPVELADGGARRRRRAGSRRARNRCSPAPLSSRCTSGCSGAGVSSSAVGSVMVAAPDDEAQQALPVAGTGRRS